MFRIRKIYDDTSPANHNAIAQVVSIMRAQFPTITEADLEKLPKQLQDPLRYRYRSILFVAEDSLAHVKGFALLLHVTDLRFCYLELLSTAAGRTGGGIGGALYEHVRDEALSLRTLGLFFEMRVDERHLCSDPATLKQSIARARFYERYGARPIINNDYPKPLHPGDENLYYLVYDDLGQNKRISREKIRKIVRAVLERKYGNLCTEEYIAAVVTSFSDDPVVLRAPRYTRGPPFPLLHVRASDAKRIALVVNDRHSILHVRERGYLEAPVRVGSILKEIGKTSLFERVEPRAFPLKHIKAVHDADYVNYLRQACKEVPPGKSVYPEVFPIRNASRPPKNLALRAGYYCIDPFTPLNQNVYPAARRAVDCALTAADLLLSGYGLAYALVRPPGHHAERRAFGGFCYFNSAAVAANYLSDIGRVAVLDIDFHHGNGTQQIFYERADVLTLSIHGHPNYVYPHFTGFEDETGQGAGRGYNVNYPLPESITPERYHATLARSLNRVTQFKPEFLIVCLGLDTANGDPTGSWPLAAADFRRNGQMVGALGLRTLVVQEGGYRTRTLGANARRFFEGLWEGHLMAAAIGRGAPKRQRISASNKALETRHPHPGNKSA